MNRFFMYLLLLFLPCSLQAAAKVTIYPTHVYLSPENQTAVITLINQGKTEVKMQLGAKSWDSNDKGEFVETDTGDFAFFPRMFSLTPNQEKKIRVGYSGNFPAREKPYRVFIEELPPLIQPEIAENQLGIITTLKLSVPLFVKPDNEQHEPQPEFGKISLDKEGIAVLLLNKGKFNFLVRGIDLQWLDANAKPITISISKEAKRVLPERFSRFDLPIIKASCDKVQKLVATVHIEDMKTPYTREFSLRGQCMP
jgi:P pilus assembly chaperone PapD